MTTPTPFTEKARAELVKEMADEYGRAGAAGASRLERMGLALDCVERRLAGAATGTGGAARADDEEDRLCNNVGQLIGILESSDAKLTCAHCKAKPAVCVGAYERQETFAPACDDCCGHGSEDGRCVQLAAAPVSGSEPVPSRLVFGCYVEDRAHGWDTSSGIYSALMEVAGLIRAGEAEASHAAGELDDLIATRAAAESTTKRGG